MSSGITPREMLLMPSETLMPAEPGDGIFAHPGPTAAISNVISKSSFAPSEGNICTGLNVGEPFSFAGHLVYPINASLAGRVFCFNSI